MKMRYLKGWTSYNESADAQKFQYMMLGRLQTDCDYFLGNGQRSVNNLWGETIEEHIAEMKKIWTELEVKPEWLTMEDIENYERQMLGDDYNSDSDYNSNIDEEAFQTWWREGGQDIADRIYSEEAKLNVQNELDALGSFDSEANTGDDNNTEIEYNNIISREIERLAKANNLHLK